MNRLIALIIEPLKTFSNRNFAERLSALYSKNKWIAYVLSLLITIVILGLAYIIPNL